MPRRGEVLGELVDRLPRLPANEVLRVAIDGVDGAGKTHLADELAEQLQLTGRTAIRASVDGFHNPRSVRYRSGRDSAEGFFRDSYDYHGLRAALLDPLSPGGSRRYRTAIFDHRRDEAVHLPERAASGGEVLLFDGIFLHRPELRVYWDYSIFLEVAFDVSIPRGAQRGEGSPDPTSPANRRYVEGQKLYLRTCAPLSYASVVLNNDDLDAPYFASRPLGDGDRRGTGKVILTGGPGVGKTTLLSALNAAGFATVAESARPIIAERLALGLSPRPAPLEFAREIVRRDIEAHEAHCRAPGWVFFDRGLIDGLGLLSESDPFTDEALRSLLARYPFHRDAFVLPPWREIYATDSERDQTFDDCLRIHDSLVRWYRRCGIVLHDVPPGTVEERVAFVLAKLADHAA